MCNLGYADVDSFTAWATLEFKKPARSFEKGTETRNENIYIDSCRHKPLRNSFGSCCYGRLIKAKRLDGWTAVFLVSTLATSVTGFLFPFHAITPGIIVGIISVVLLAGAIIARYFGGLLGRWRLLYVVTAMISLYLNVFVLIAQLFEKVPSLKVLAPTQTEPAFLMRKFLLS